MDEAIRILILIVAPQEHAILAIKAGSLRVRVPVLSAQRISMLAA
jgi:hypothetical protein